MSFFILTGAILLGTIFIVHYAANALGFRLFYMSLFLSAALALAVNLIVISMKEVTSPLSIAKIFLIVLLASAFVTFVNDVFTRREIKKLQKRRAKRKEEASEYFDEEVSEEYDEGTFESENNDDLQSACEENVVKKESFFKRLLNKLSFFNFKKSTNTSEESDETEKIADALVDEKEEAEVFADTEEKAESLPVAVEAVMSAEKTETEETKESNQDENLDKVTEDKPKKDGFFNKLFKKSEPPKREKLDMSQFADLDAVLDFAYDAKIAGRYLDAVDAYEGAIEQYENDPYLPFLFIDLGNVHKAQGEYNAAIDVYEKAVNMPNIQKDLNILKSFEENIDYLKTLKIVLRKHKAEHKPFGEINEAILKEVENSLNK